MYSPPVLRKEKESYYIGIPLQFSERKRKVAVYVFPPVLGEEKEKCYIGII